jgi:hypothetical protein
VAAQIGFTALLAPGMLTREEGTSPVRELTTAGTFRPGAAPPLRSDQRSHAAGS